MTTSYAGQGYTFTALPTWLRGQATPWEGWVMWVLQSHYPTIKPSLSLLEKETGISRSKLCQVLSDMERKGWLTREQVFSSNGRKANTIYRLSVWEENRDGIGSARGGLVREMDYQGSAQDGLGIVRHTDYPSAPHALKEKQVKKIKKSKKTAIEPPFVFPPAGESAGQAVATHTQPDPYPDQVQTQDPNPLPEHPDPCLHQETHQRPLEAAVSDENPLKASFPDEPQQGALEALLEASEENTPAKGKKPRFQPTEADIPAILLPVAPEILGFWKAKAGKKTSEAWKLLLTELHKIWDDPAGGTDVLRQQLEAGIEAKIYGDGWQSIKYANWKKYARDRHRSNTQPQLTKYQKAGLSALAKIRAMEAQKAQEQQSNTLAIGGSLL
jgi:hypothetical protein